MYTLNLLFDFNRSDGLFSDKRYGSPLVNSNIWLKLEERDPQNLDPEIAPWEDLGEPGPLLVTDPIGHVIGVRIARDPDGAQIYADTNLNLVVGFGAPLASKQPSASPFKGPDGAIMAAFQFSGPMNSPAAKGPPVAWFFRLGTIAVPATHSNKAHRYEFALGAIVTQRGTTRTFGLDPEMDVAL